MNKDKTAKLIEDNMGLVGYTLKIKGINRILAIYKNLSYEDCYQEGCYALCRAAAGFDENKGKFSTYAVICISNHISNYLRDSIGGKAGEIEAFSLDDKADETGRTLEEIIPSEDKGELGYFELKKDILDLAKSGGAELEAAAKIFIRCAEEGISLLSYSKEAGLSYPKLIRQKNILKKMFDNSVCAAV